jgi:Argonaute linker 1 domain
MALDVLIRHEPSIKYIATVGRFGRSFYVSNGIGRLKGGLEAWQGYYQSARPTPGRMMINIDL